MKQDQFNEIIEKQLETIKNTLLVKSKEYATVDKLHNFRTAAILQQCTMEQALAGMLSKHTVSIYDMIQSGDRYHVDKWDEKINDHIIYLLLLRAIIEEKLVEEYPMGAEPEVMVNNPTYSFFMETLKRPYRSEFMDKKFNVPFEESCMPRTNAMIDETIDEISSLESIGKLCESTEKIGTYTILINNEEVVLKKGVKYEFIFKEK